MGKVKKILFYNDSCVFGGHEIMSIRIANFLAEKNDYQINFLYNNNKIKSKLDAKVVAHHSSINDSTPFSFILNLNFFKINKIKNRIKLIDPDVVVVCQGNIELCLKGLIASKLLGIKTISYLPFAYKFKEINKNLSFIRDKINNYYYKLPDSFLTISNYQKSLIRRFTLKKINLIINPINELYHKSSKHSFFNNDDKKIDVGIIGRIDFKHKNQNSLIEISKKLISNNFLFHFHLLGDGKDLNHLIYLVKKNDLSNYFTFYGWVDKKKKESIMQNLDLIFIPSMFEGVPLILLESIAYGMPFLISDLDCIDDFSLDQNYIVDINDIDMVVEKIILYKNNFNEHNFIKTRNRIYKNNNINKFENNILKSFDEILCGL